MPTYQRFEDLPVWQSAAGLYDRVDDFIDRAPQRLRHSSRDQLERATLSVSNNIAEGFERGTHQRAVNVSLHRPRLGWGGALHADRRLPPAVSRKFQTGDLRFDKNCRVLLAPASRLGGFQQTLVQHLPLDHPMHPQNRREPDAPDNSRI